MHVQLTLDETNFTDLVHDVSEYISECTFQLFNAARILEYLSPQYVEIVAQRLETLYWMVFSSYSI